MIQSNGGYKAGGIEKEDPQLILQILIHSQHPIKRQMDNNVEFINSGDAYYISVFHQKLH